MKLHLGCGQKYLDGYCNIDFPLSEHSVQKTSRVDKYADVLGLKYKINSVSEIRMHHVFEHFNRSQICALLASWNSWLKKGGILRIEVPDFYRNSLVLLNPVSSLHSKLMIERHIFGSQEASWAIHYEGYTVEVLRFLLKSFGFRVDKVRRNHWKGTHNIDITASKIETIESVAKAKIISKDVLKNYLVDNSPSEVRLLGVWLKIFNKQLSRSFSRNG